VLPKARRKAREPLRRSGSGPRRGEIRERSHTSSWRLRVVASSPSRWQPSATGRADRPLPTPDAPGDDSQAPRSSPASRQGHAPARPRPAFRGTPGGLWQPRPLPSRYDKGRSSWHRSPSLPCRRTCRKGAGPCGPAVSTIPGRARPRRVPWRLLRWPERSVATTYRNKDRSSLRPPAIPAPGASRRAPAAAAARPASARLGPGLAPVFHSTAPACPFRPPRRPRT